MLPPWLLRLSPSRWAAIVAAAAAAFVAAPNADCDAPTAAGSVAAAVASIATAVAAAASAFVALAGAACDGGVAAASVAVAVGVSGGLSRPPPRHLSLSLRMALSRPRPPLFSLPSPRRRCWAASRASVAAGVTAFVVPAAAAFVATAGAVAVAPTVAVGGVWRSRLC